MILGIIFLLLVLATLWTAVVLLSLPWALAVIPTLVVVTAAVGILAFRRFQAHKAAKEIESSLKAQSEDYAKKVRPDQQPEIEAMHAEFTKAISSLKTSKLARGGMDALSVLPWYLIIGPPGAGKSTALKNSGLQFPYLSARGGGVRGVGGTRNCEWWLTNEAVILDTAGRYTTEDDDHDEWFSFLDMLVKNRPKKPINGVIVAVGIGDFVGLDEDGAASLGQLIRDRVDEVMERLKIIVPVYVLFTKCDLLAGFVEMFGDLPKGERGQIWGATEPVGAKAVNIGDQFLIRYDELIAVLEKRALQRLGQTRRIEDREQIFQFPAQVESLRINLSDFIRTLFTENIYRDTPLIRGFYLSSATQEGKPIDRMMNAIASAFGIQATLPLPADATVVTKSYFLHDLFTKVIFKDQELAARSTKERKRQGILQYGYTAGLLGAAALLIFLPAISYFQNREFVQQTRDLLATADTNRNERPNNSTLARLDPLRGRVDDLLEARRPFLMGFGLYQGPGLLEKTSRVYATKIKEIMIEPIYKRHDEEMRAFVEKLHAEILPSEGWQYFNKLKLHLLLTTPKEKAEPEIDEKTQAWIVTELTDAWIARAPGDRAASMAQAHADLFLKLLSRDPTLAFARDNFTVGKLRQLMAQHMPIVTLVLQKMIQSASGEDITVSNLLDNSLPDLKSKEVVRAAFTTRMYREHICSNFDSAMKDSDPWVLAAEGKALDSEASTQELREKYFKQYTAEWHNFIASLSLEPPDDPLVLLDRLTKGSPPPLAKLFQGVAENVRFDREKTPASKKIAEKGGALGKLLGNAIDMGCKNPVNEKKVQEVFEKFVRFGAPSAPTGENAPPKKTQLDDYQLQLERVRDAMRSNQGLAGLSTIQKEVEDSIQAQDPQWRARFEALLLPPFNKARRVNLQKKSGEISNKWCSQVSLNFHKNLSNRYPFKSSDREAGLGDVSEFFRPNTGLLWSFQKSELPEVVQAGSHFKYASGPGVEAGSVIRKDLLGFLDQALRVTTALFSPGSPDVQFNFSFRIRPDSRNRSVTLAMDGQTYTLQNQPEEWPAWKWPVAGKAPDASLVVVTKKGGPRGEIRKSGEWAFFRLLEEGMVTNAGSTFTILWRFPNADTDVTIDFRPARSETPFGMLKVGQKPQLHVLQGVSPPLTAGHNQAGCKL